MNILLVGNATTPGTADTTIQSILTGLGHTVSYQNVSASIPANLTTAYDVLVISASVSSGAVDPWADEAIPILNMESFSYDTTSQPIANADPNTLHPGSNDLDIRFVDVSHPVTKSWTLNQEVSLAAGFQMQSTPITAFGPGVTILGVHPDATSNAVLWAIDQGGEMSDTNPATHRRVGLHADYGAGSTISTFGNLTTLIGDALDWLLNGTIPAVEAELAGDVQLPEGSFAAGLTLTGGLSGDVALPIGSLTTTSSIPATLSGQPSGPTGDLEATLIIPATLGGQPSSPTGNLSLGLVLDATLNGQPLSPTGTLDALLWLTGELGGQVPNVEGFIEGTSGLTSTIAGEVLLPEGNIDAFFRLQGVTVNGETGLPEGTFEATYIIPAPVREGTWPAMSGSFTGTMLLQGLFLEGELPLPTGFLYYVSDELFDLAITSLAPVVVDIVNLGVIVDREVGTLAPVITPSPTELPPEIRPITLGEPSIRPGVGLIVVVPKHAKEPEIR